MHEESGPRSITIVGGGSSGWMTALYLNTLFNAERPNYRIRVIESPDIGIIGVGESTVHSVRFFLQSMGLDEIEFMRAVHGALKLGIMFKDWRKPVDGRRHAYFHPFEQQHLGRGHDLSTLWLLADRARHERYDEGVSIGGVLASARHAPKTPHSRQYQGAVPYGYHIDATLLARFLRGKAVAAGVEHIEGTITDVDIADGMIRAVNASNGQRYESDFFIDCTGFRGLLMEKLKPGNWDSFEKALPCNRAVAIQREFPDDSGPKPYTVATALSNGWAWQIDLVNRQGTGYVYDGNRLSREQAEQELREFLGPSKVLLVNHLDMKVGCRHEFWVGNCVAIGLAGGFIEPLESTGLHLINLGAGLLATHHPVREAGQPIRDSYNRLMRGFYQDLKQFIVLHYCLSDRDDTEFWRAAPATAAECPWLQSQLEIWRHKVCEYHDLAGSFSTIFADDNYRFVLYGMQHHPRLALDVDAAASEAIFAEQRRIAGNALAQTSAHGDYLRQLNL